MRELSANAYQAVIQRITDEIFLALLTITVERLDETGETVTDIYRVVAGSDTDIVSNGQTFTPYAFEILLPQDSLESVEQVQLRIDNVDRLLVDGLRSATKPLSFDLKIVLASSPDTIEVELNDLEGREVQWDASTIQATLTLLDTWNQKFPGVGDVYDPRQCPELF